MELHLCFRVAGCRESEGALTHLASAQWTVLNRFPLEREEFFFLPAEGQLRASLSERDQTESSRVLVGVLVSGSFQTCGHPTHPASWEVALAWLGRPESLGKSLPQGPVAHSLV